MEIVMSDTAFQTQYRDEFIAAFEDRASILRAACITEAVIKGNTATFLVAGSGSATATTRGVDGRIPGRADDLTQTSATLAEWHDVVEKTNFNIFASQGNQKRIMQETTMAVINRKIDDLIIAQLDTATQDTGSVATASLDMVIKSKVILGNAFVPTQEEDNMFGLITPAFEGYLMQVKEYASADYVEVKPFAGAARRFRRWAGINWMVHPRLTGVGTSTEKCYLFHRNALGFAADTAGMDSLVGYDGRHAFSWARCSMHMGSKLLQNTGIVQMKHDGSAYVAA
jgi:hypothetical protein